MNNGNYVNKDTIISRVYRYYGIDATGHDVDEFIYDGLRMLGTNKMYDLIITNGEDTMPEPIEVENYRGIIPSNIEYPIAVIDYESKQPMYCVDSVFREDFTLNIHSNKTYYLKRNHIFTNEQSQKLVFIYLGFPLDEAGYPLVLDVEEYLAAITAYVAKNIAFKMYMQDQILERKFDRIEQEYFSLAHGVNSLEIPDETEMEMIKNQFLNKTMDYDAFATRFKNLGFRTHIKYT